MLDFFEFPFGRIAVLWETRPRFQLVKICLPPFAPKAFSALAKRTNDRRIKTMVAGLVHSKNKKIRLPLKPATPFQQKILDTLRSRVPRGKVITYARLAEKAGFVRAARAVGSAMARNPWPLLFPCHRTIGSQGKLGGFQGNCPTGPLLKRRLLEMEGVGFDTKGHIFPEFIL